MSFKFHCPDSVARPTAQQRGHTENPFPILQGVREWRPRSQRHLEPGPRWPESLRAASAHPEPTAHKTSKLFSLKVADKRKEGGHLLVTSWVVSTTFGIHTHIKYNISLNPAPTDCPHLADEEREAPRQLNFLSLLPSHSPRLVSNATPSLSPGSHFHCLPSRSSKPLLKAAEPQDPIFPGGSTVVSHHARLSPQAPATLPGTVTDHPLPSLPPKGAQAPAPGALCPRPFPSPPLLQADTL